MGSIGHRISLLIQQLGITKSNFASQINISQPFVSELCSGTKLPSDRTISDICRVFGVDEVWLRDGIGEDMFRKKTLSDELAEFFAYLSCTDDNFKRSFVATLARMTPEEWRMVERKCRELLDEMQKDGSQ